MRDTKLVQDWLSQFSGSDKLLAQTLLDSLTLISSTEFVDGLTKQILLIAKSHPGKNALIPIRKIKKDKFLDENKQYRKQYSSADWIGYMLTEIERSDSKSFVVEPTVESMRSEKIKNIILVDDIVGTGRRVIDFWKQLDKSIKSWISYKKCKIWLITYAAHSAGVDSIIKKIGPMTQENIFSELCIESEQPSLNEKLQQLCIEYSTKTSKPNAALGFGQNQNLRIFEFSCPNNSPAILWANGKEWKALFPNRSIPIELKPYFSKQGKEKQLNFMFDANQQKLALHILYAIENHKLDDEYFYILVLLGFIQRGYQYKNLLKLMVLGRSKLNELLKQCTDHRLIESKGVFHKKYILTIWGSDLLKRYQEINFKKVKNNETSKELCVYYPVQFQNVPAKN